MKKKIRAWDGSRLAWPTNWNELFGRAAPLMLEIGFGDGQFLVDLACRRPEANVIGVEISLPSIKKGESKAARLTPGNVQIVHGDARLVLWGAILPASLAGVYLNFPDPWHKTAHHNRKLINDPFLVLLASRMAAGAALQIATDDPGYQEAIAGCLERTELFFPLDGRMFTTSDPARLVTKYEQKALREGRTPHYYNWVRGETAAPDRYPLPKEFDMPHAVIKSSLTHDEIAGRFAVMRFEGEVPIRLLSIYRGVNSADGDYEMLLVEAHVVEEPLPQRLALFIQARQEGEILLGLHELGFPRPTEGVHIAVGHLARWLLSLDPGMALVRHNLNREI